MVKKFKPSVKKKYLDRLFSNFVLFRDNRTCQRCNKSDGKMDCAHIIPRAVLSLRWSGHNAITLCFKCHMTWHNNPLVIVRWFETKYGKLRADQLLLEASNSFELTPDTFEQTKKRLLKDTERYLSV